MNYSKPVEKKLASIENNSDGRIAATHCATRRVPLVTGVMGWWWPHFDETPSGESMRTRTTAAVGAELPLYDLLRTQLELGTREPGPLANHDRYDIIAAVRHFARYTTPEGNLVNPVKNKNPDIEAGFALLTMSHAARVTWFCKWYEATVPAATRRRGIRASTTVGSHHHQGRVGNALWEAVEAGQYEGFAQVGVLGRKRGKLEGARYERFKKSLKSCAFRSKAFANSFAPSAFSRIGSGTR